MTRSDDLDTGLENHRDIRQRMPHVWNAFFAGFGTLRDIQLKAMPPILDGTSVLVTAPTAGGKTEAVIAPACERLCRHRWQGLSILIITPTRALVNDLYARLTRPCNQLKISLGRKTADHPSGDKVSKQVLITTPESTESLLTFRREWLNDIQVIILDEIHLLDGSPRGDQLRGILNRLLAYRRYSAEGSFAGIQRVALSATVSDPRRLANVYVGEGSEVVSVAGQRALEAKVVLGGQSDRTRAEAAIGNTDSFGEVHKILVFVNSRKQVDTCTGFFKCGRFSQVPVYGHHGSLSKSQREDVEARFKSNSEAICIATMTLEVGIDIGDIDLIVCMDPPFSLPSFLQRIGRGCRRLDGATRVLCVARDRASELMFQALIRQAGIGVPQGPVAPFRRSVMIQQILAYLKQVTKHRRVTRQFLDVFASPNCPGVSEDCIRQVLADMCQSGLLDKQGDVFRPASPGWEFIESRRIYANIQATPLEIALVDVSSGRIVATVAAVADSSRGVRVAGRSYDILPGGSSMQQKVRQGGEHVDSPRYHARSLPYAYDVGASLAGLCVGDTSALAVLNVGDTVVVMTWLGRLLNRILAEGMKRSGCKVTDGSFHLTVTDHSEETVIELLRQAVHEVTHRNPLSTISPERMVDIGPHFKRFSPSLQGKAREDWLDVAFLENWIKGIKDVKRVSVDSKSGADLLALTQV